MIFSLFLQGNNYCKQLGIKKDVVITSKDFDLVWKKYSKEHELDKGTIDLKGAKKFLKHFANAIGEEYDKQKAEELLQSIDTKKIGYISYNLFKVMLPD